MAVRVYELSKKLGISNKELVDLLKEHGYTLTSIAVVPDEAVKLIETSHEKKAPVQPEKRENPPVRASEPSQPEPQKVIAPKKEEPKTLQIAIKHAAPRPATKSQQPQPQEAEAHPAEISIVPMTVADIAHKARKQVSEVMLTLLKMGVVATKNQMLAEKNVAELARQYGLTVVTKAPVQAKEEKTAQVQEAGQWESRMPVVVVIGHVDHGKTTLLDFIRKTRVAAKEKGGITQHLGAYEVKTEKGNLVFLDTPGHEAFTLMRARGIKVADIAILVVAADDGVMPQTVDAIKRAKLAEIPIIVALNKIDKATPAQIETAKRQLAQHDLTPEEWGGDTVCLPISAKLGTGIDELLDVIVLQSQLMDLKANISIPARGFVLESTVEKGRGPVATVICQHGILKVGDYFTAGNATGRISSLVNSAGKRIQEVPPSVPVLVAGFSELPHAGDAFEVTTQQAIRKGGVKAPSKTAEIMSKTGTEESEIALIVKADNASSREAVAHGLSQLKSSHRTLSLVYTGVGDISESDIILAADTGAIIYGFHVKVQPHAADLVHKKGVEIKSFDIIYKLIEDVEQLLEAGKPVKMVSKKIGEAIVLKVFDIKGLGIIAGAQVKTGRFIRDGKVIIWRGKHKVGEGSIKGLQRDRKPVKEVHTGFECAFLVDGFDAWEVDDRVECFQEVPA